MQTQRSRRVFCAALAFLVLACASTAMPSVDLAKANCGAYPSSYEALIKDWFESRLKDPYSAEISIFQASTGLTSGMPHPSASQRSSATSSRFRSTRRTALAAMPAGVVPVLRPRRAKPRPVTRTRRSRSPGIRAISGCLVMAAHPRRATAYPSPWPSPPRSSEPPGPDSPSGQPQNVFLGVTGARDRRSPPCILAARSWPSFAGREAT